MLDKAKDVLVAVWQSPKTLYNDWSHAEDKYGLIPPDAVYSKRVQLYLEKKKERGNHGMDN